MTFTTTPTLPLILAILLAACGGNRPTAADHDAGPVGGPSDAGPATSAAEACDGFDNDGDGDVDEDCTCETGASQPCFPFAPELAGVGACAMGVQTCEGAGEFLRWGACDGAVGPSVEIENNGIDDDCDGEGLGCAAAGLGSTWVAEQPGHGWWSSLAVDDDNNVIALHHFENVMGEGTPALVKLDPSGGELWRRTIPGTWYGFFGGAFGHWGAGSPIGTDAAGNIYFAAHFSEPFELAGVTINPTGPYDRFIASYTPDGEPRWAQRIEAIPATSTLHSYGWGMAVAVAPDGNMSVVGHFQSEDVFGAGENTHGFLAMYEADGSHRLSTGLGRADNNIGWRRGGLGITADDDGNITFTGYFGERLVIDGHELLTSGPHERVLVSLTREGAHRWSHVLSGDESPTMYRWHGRGVVTDATGNVYLAGGLEGALEIDGEPVPGTGGAAYVASFTPEGRLRWGHSFPDADFRWSSGLAAEPSGRVHFIGNHSADGAVLISLDEGGIELSRRSISSRAAHVGSIAAGCGAVYLSGLVLGQRTPVLGIPSGADGQQIAYVARAGDE